MLLTSDPRFTRGSSLLELAYHPKGAQFWHQNRSFYATTVNCTLIFGYVSGVVQWVELRVWLMCSACYSNIYAPNCAYYLDLNKPRSHPCLRTLPQTNIRSILAWHGTKTKTPHLRMHSLACTPPCCYMVPNWLRVFLCSLVTGSLKA